MNLLSRPHHDGSPLYLRVGSHALSVRIRIPSTWPDVEAVRVRTTPNGDPMAPIAAVVESVTAECTWWSAEVPIENPVVRYRFFVQGSRDVWVNAAGVAEHEVPDSADFVVVVGANPPSWLTGTVGYQVFPDRFARSGATYDVPAWAVPADWDDPLHPDPSIGVHQYYGGDLPGLQARLDHLARVGATLLYLTPVFPAGSTHRYDSTTFDSIDPLLGGDEAYASLIAAAQARGIRVIGDITLNHSGSNHEWFVAAQADPASTEAGFYIFDNHPDAYRAWYDVPSLPKLDHRSPALAERLISGPDSVIRKWLRPPYNLDGWRVDCANVTGRIDEVDLNLEVAEATLAAIVKENPDAWLLAEHLHDAQPDLARRGGWHGTMNSARFQGPVASWLIDPVAFPSQRGVPNRSRDGQWLVSSLEALNGGMPWSAVTASMIALDSHDTARFRTVVGGSVDRHLAGMAMLFTFPGVPTIFAGSEIGAEGDSMDAGRVPFNWDESTWNTDFLAAITQLAAIRKSSPALQSGGIRFIHATPDSITYLRESPTERLLIHIARSAHDPISLDLAALGTATVEVLFGPPLGVSSSSAFISAEVAGATICRLQ